MIRDTIRKGLLVAMFGLVIAAPTAARAEKLDLSEGTMEIGGYATIGYGGVLGNTNNVANKTSEWDGTVAVNFGYFVVDNLMLSINVQASGLLGVQIAGTNIIGNSVLNLESAAGAGVGIGYFFDTGSIVYPYLNANVNFLWDNGGVNPINFNNNAFVIQVNPAVGILIGLNKHVALDLGASFDFNINATNANTSANTWGVNMGYVGVRAFF